MNPFWNQQWLNANSQRSYPLFEEASKIDETGTFTVPDNFLLAVRLSIHSGLDVLVENFYLQALTTHGTGVRIDIGYADGTANPPIVAVAVVNFATHIEYDLYALNGQGDFDDTQGSVVVGDVLQIKALPPGRYVFGLEGGRLDSDCVRPNIRGVQSLTLLNGNEESERIYGDIVLIAGKNTRLTVVQASGQDPKIRIDAISGEGLNGDCECVTDIPCIKTINGIGPDDNDNIAILGNDCMEVTSEDHSIKLSDLCSQPCCGCAELETITRALETQSQELAILTGFVNRQEAEVAQMRNLFVGSTLRRSGCLEC